MADRANLHPQERCSAASAPHWRGQNLRTGQRRPGGSRRVVGFIAPIPADHRLGVADAVHLADTWLDGGSLAYPLAPPRRWVEPHQLGRQHLGYLETTVRSTWLLGLHGLESSLPEEAKPARAVDRRAMGGIAFGSVGQALGPLLP